MWENVRFADRIFVIPKSRGVDTALVQAVYKQPSR